jgi:uncharacterized protein
MAQDASEQAVPPRIMFVELPASDIEKSSRFYEQLFGWRMTAFGPSYACTMAGDVDLGLQADRAEATAAPLPVVQVADLERAAATAQTLGARITRPIFSFPGGRRFHIVDPSGTEIALMQAA